MAQKIDNLFFNFIDEATEFGKKTRSEQSHSNGVNDKESAKDAIKFYGDLLKKVNDKFEKFKSTAEKEFTI